MGDVRDDSTRPDRALRSTEEAVYHTGCKAIHCALIATAYRVGCRKAHLRCHRAHHCLESFKHPHIVEEFQAETARFSHPLGRGLAPRGAAHEDRDMVGPHQVQHARVQGRVKGCA